MKLFNTLTRQLEEFKPLTDKKVLFYQCGPTVYWTQHIGNMRAMVMSDLIRRTLLYLGYKVTFVRNYTDVGHLTGDNIGDADQGEDKMDKGARREGLTPDQIANKYIQIFENDINELNILPPDYKPRPTEYIKQIIEMVQTLLDKGYAYVTPKAVYFDVTKAKDYTRLSRQKVEDNIKGAGTGDVTDPQKKHPADFALWFFKTGVHKNALQYWSSPFHSPEVNNGEGFPGWHIECSVMAKSLLGNTLDIHMGGIEHIPIHHTNEIAQSEAANGVKFVNYWLHNEHLNVSDRKMAKSEGTGYSLAEVKSKGFEPLALRYFYLNAHYRSQQNFTWDALQDAQNSLNRLRSTIGDLKRNNEMKNDQQISDDSKKFLKKIEEAVSQDFNIPQAVGIMWEMLRSNITPSDKLSLLLNFDQVLGLKLSNIKEEKIPEHIKKLAEERQQAKQVKDYAKADEFRKKIESEGYRIEDSNDGYLIRRIN